MYKKTMIASGIAMAVAAMSVMADGHGEDEGPFADFEISGELKNETAVFTKDGTTIGAASAHDNGDLMKSESSARLFINGVVGESAELHAELRPVRDGEAVDGMKGHENYTQQDWLRELYVDTVAGEEEEIALRIGKQQVVWGTADGMKLLDIINPTDYREMAQNSMDESRIPVWMVNAEMDLEDGSNLQVVISQPKENVFAGLDRNIDTSVRANAANGADTTTAAGHSQGSAFVMKGVDSITGKTNGFLNIVPDLGSVAAGFYGVFGTNLQHSSMTVAQFTAMAAADMDGTAGNGTGGADGANPMGTTIGGYADLGMDGAMILAAFAGNYDSNLNNATNSTDWGVIDDSAFEYMGNATFGTFDAFVNARSQYVYNMPDDSDVDLAVRLKRSLDNGLNYSLNYSYNYDKNPIINLSWRDTQGRELVKTIDANNTISLADIDGNVYGGAAAAGVDGQLGTADDVTDRFATLRFEQKVERAHNIGSAMDYAIDTENLGAVVLRGEFLYQKDVYQPVMDLNSATIVNDGSLVIGDMTDALKMEKTNRFKYVLGADITVLTNMMVSAQFIQDRNIGHIDTGTRYTTNYATMHPSNGFQKAEENKEFYSLFFSKPFGAEQQHRWNNIFMFEENGGKWNRFDVEYSFNDELIGTAEYNKYWGDANTQFGQLEASSNFQLGLKYLF